MAIVKGVGSNYQWGAAMGAHKAPKRNVEDYPHLALAVTIATQGIQPSPFVVWPPQGLSEADPNSSSRNQARILVEEELSMIDSGMLPPSCKDLAFASVHLTPFKFHEGL